MGKADHKRRKKEGGRKGKLGIAAIKYVCVTYSKDPDRNTKHHGPEGEQLREK